MCVGSAICLRCAPWGATPPRVTPSHRLSNEAHVHECNGPRRVQTRAWLALVLFITDLFHPIDDLAVDMFLDGDMGHGRRRRRAVPVLDGRRNPDDVARAD